ncbi:Rossmann-like and DUF2520 domain-containing protein [Paludibacterium purpuratum]|uniref:Putative short-subunit dehydrogenase-like oxidoreductase (DUF2520 family) n=1 Tax=Paludibacterium purpuratum TaxID=1144873 RepID=A0A4R7BEV9_9NEIS|nr:Rossmann-like and DUF2520 domain-containing protein [Paludibacterium purpuratum]TDR82812.1 putative short-subunit dehydrogenase-like oxidoreductase (DUF2520 family) [Paludibacterium purpuratum]
MQTLAIFGAGRLGQSWGRLAQQSGRYRVVAVCCRSEAAARRAVDFIGAGQPATLDAPVALADLNLLAVPDDALAELATRLADRPTAIAATAFHASGVLDSAVLAPLTSAGLVCGSLHPAFSFAEPARAVQTFAGTLCALEGNAAAQTTLQAFAAAIGGRPFSLTPGSKAAYHASLSIASNFLVTLTGLAQAVAAQAGIEGELARSLLGNLMHQSLDNALTLGAARALTGPIARGDAATVRQHLAVLGGTPQAALYLALGRATLALAQHSAEHAGVPADAWARLSAELADPSAVAAPVPSIAVAPSEACATGGTAAISPTSIAGPSPSEWS